MESLGLRGLGFSGSGFRVSGLGFRAWGLGLRGLGFRALGLGFRVLGCRVDCGLRALATALPETPIALVFEEYTPNQGSRYNLRYIP